MHMRKGLKKRGAFQACSPSRGRFRRRPGRASAHPPPCRSPEFRLPPRHKPFRCRIRPRPRAVPVAKAPPSETKVSHRRLSRKSGSVGRRTKPGAPHPRGCASGCRKNHPSHIQRCDEHDPGRRQSRLHILSSQQPDSQNGRQAATPYGASTSNAAMKPASPMAAFFCPLL